MPQDLDAEDGRAERERQARRAFEHGSSGATADFATDAHPRREDSSAEGPYARPAPPLAPDELCDQLADRRAVSEDDLEARLDEANEESFPASDPPSLSPGRRT